MMLDAKDLTITFNPGTPIETKALRGMSIAIPKGQFVTVIGSNGAGKSTLLNAISGAQAVDGGSIQLAGVDVTRQPVWQRAKMVARVFQDPMAGTCEELTIEENLALAAHRGGKRGFRLSISKAMRDEFQERLALLGLGLENRRSEERRVGKECRARR